MVGLKGRRREFASGGGHRRPSKLQIMYGNGEQQLDSELD
jgi:hypothetical protein